MDQEEDIGTESPAGGTAVTGWGLADGEPCGWGDASSLPCVPQTIISRWGDSSAAETGDWGSVQNTMKPCPSGMLKCVEDEAVDGEEDCDMDEGVPEDCVPNTFYAQQISTAEYARQTKQYTQEAVAALVQSAQYQHTFTTCQLCWSVWAEGQYSDNCLECGGFAMQRSCPICQGKCPSVWTRDVELSHSHNEAHWDGECGLPYEQRLGFMQQTLMEDADEDTVFESFTDLHT